jgi:hypothetical protein
VISSIAAHGRTAKRLDGAAIVGVRALVQTIEGLSPAERAELIALLRASNIPARYVKAQVRITDPTPDPLGGRVARWLADGLVSGLG